VTPEDVVGLLADEGRLRLVAALVLDAGTTQEVATRAGIPARKAIEALTRLEASGLVSRDPQGRWAFELDPLREIARSARPARDGPAGSPTETVLRGFITDGRLVQIPAARSKRVVVLDHLAGGFEPGRKYGEREVNEMLRRWHDDVAALRRYLVDEGFLSRDHAVYWRSGGSIDVDA
jgi:hypothetical protein